MTKQDNGGPVFPQLENTEIFTMHDGEYNYTESEYMPQSVGGISYLDYAAIHAPEPTQDEIEWEAKKDKLANPHNEPRKPKLRDRWEIVAYLRYSHATAMLAEKRRREKED